MAITSVGYAGTITDADWRRMAVSTVGVMYGVDDYASWRPTVGVGDRAVRVAVGGGFGLGVRDVNDAVVTLSLASVASGSRWDLIVARRNWTTSTTTFVVIQGTATKALPSRNTGFGNINDQPIALVRVAAGQAAVQEILDLRCIPGDGGITAFHDLARSYLDRVGTVVRIGQTLWNRIIDSAGSPAWDSIAVLDDTDWIEVTRNPGWAFAVSQMRRVSGIVFFRFVATRSAGWAVDNALIDAIPVGYRPTVLNWYVGSSHGTGRSEFRVTSDGRVVASVPSNGATGVTLYGSFPL